jgi:hypothetical protein
VVATQITFVSRSKYIKGGVVAKVSNLMAKPPGPNPWREYLMFGQQ